MKSSAYPRLDGLVDLACRDGVDVRPTLLRVITDLYVQKPTHSADEVTQYVELTLGLIETVDDATRTAVAASLAHYPAAPAAILAKLGVSAPQSAAATALPDVNFATEAVSMEVSKTDSLVDLFFDSSSEDRRLILLNVDAASNNPAHQLAPASGEIIKRLENAALQRNTADFSRTLERALSLPRALADRVARDASGEPIVVAAKALGMKSAVLQRILLFINPAVGQSVQRVYELAELFEELTQGAAEEMLAIWRTEGGVTAPVHQPTYSQDGARDVRTHGAHRDVRDPVQQPAQIKSAG